MKRRTKRIFGALRGTNRCLLRPQRHCFINAWRSLQGLSWNLFAVSSFYLVTQRPAENLKFWVRRDASCFQIELTILIEIHLMWMIGWCFGSDKRDFWQAAYIRSKIYWFSLNSCIIQYFRTWWGSMRGKNYLSSRDCLKISSMFIHPRKTFLQPREIHAKNSFSI